MEQELVNIIMFKMSDTLDNFTDDETEKNSRGFIE